MDEVDQERTLANIQADIEHLEFVNARIEDTLVLHAEDMALRRALRWAIRRKRRIQARLRQAGAPQWRRAS